MWKNLSFVGFADESLITLNANDLSKEHRFRVFFKKFMRCLGSKVFIEYSSEEGLLSVRQSVWAEAGKKIPLLFFSPNSFPPP